MFDQSSIAKLNDSQYYLALELCKFLEKKNQDSLYLWTYKDTKAPIVSYLDSEYGYNPEHTYWASNPLELLDYIRDTCQVPENKIVFVDYQANKSLPYQTALSKTQYTRIGPLDFIVESESRHYRETKKYISCYAKEFANCYMNALNNPVPVSLLSGDRKPQIRFLGNHHSGSGNLYHKSFRM